jgi:uncharacterized protein (DUF952 family)
MSSDIDPLKSLRVFKILSADEWTEAKQSGTFTGSRDDRRDGFIHLSTAVQVAGTAARHFAGQHGLVLVAFDAARLGPALKWEPSRGGALFPHLYAPLPIDAVLWTRDMKLGPDGIPTVPGDLEQC